MKKEIEQLICDAYLHGESYIDISKKNNIHITTFYNILKRNNIKAIGKDTQKYKSIKHCRVCNIELDDKNWAPPRKERREYICKKCITNYNRHTRIDTCDKNGKRITYVCKKRKFNNVCEMCGKSIQNNPHYHHWDDTKPELGIWVCASCHIKCGVVEDNTFDIFKNNYVKCKEEINISAEEIK